MNEQWQDMLICVFVNWFSSMFTFLQNLLKKKQFHYIINHFYFINSILTRQQRSELRSRTRKQTICFLHWRIIVRIHQQDDVVLPTAKKKFSNDLNTLISARLVFASFPYQMLNLLKVLHIVAVATISISYTCFIIQLANSEIYVYVLLSLYSALLFVYSIQTYAAFHSPPTQPNLHTTQFDIGLIFAYKLTQERRRELRQALKTASSQERAKLEKDYINEYQKPSFCDICERVQPSRAHHCQRCDCCIMRKQMHSNLLGFCIGENNQIAYLLYLMVSKLLSLFAFVTLALVHLTTDKFQKLSDALAIYYLILIFLLALAVFTYSRKFFFLKAHIQANKTIIESSDPYLDTLYFDSSKTQLSYWIALKKLLRVKRLSEQSEWLGEMQEEETD